MLRRINNTKYMHSHQFVKVTNVSSGEVTYYKNASQAAHSIGVSHVMAIKVLRG